MSITEPDQWSESPTFHYSGRASADGKFAAAVAGYGIQFQRVEQLAEDGLGDDEMGYRTEFVGLVRKAARLT